MDSLNNRWRCFLKGSIAFLLAAVLLLCSVPLLALAEETDGEEVYTYELRYKYETEKTITEKKYFIESKFRLAFMHTNSRAVKYINKEIVYDKYGLIADADNSGILRVLCESYTSMIISTGEVTDLRPESGYETLGYTALASVDLDKLSTLGFEVTFLETDIPILDSLEQIKIYFETGEDPSNERDFSGEYDPDVPVPELTNLSHNGFKVANAADNLELDLVVESKFYGLIHADSPDWFVLNKNEVIGSHYYDCSAFCDVGYYKSDYNILEDYKCTNLEDLVNDGVEFFGKYPSHKDLLDYSFTKHSASGYFKQYAALKYLFADLTDTAKMQLALAATGQAETKYYVRFYQLKDSSSGYTMLPGQWYCYTYRSDNFISMSPIEGGEDGKPIETDPIDGDQSEDGSPNYGGGNGFDIDTSNPIEMLSSFLNFVMELPSLFTGYSTFLQSAFPFIPQNVWGIYSAGIGFAVVFLIFRAIS